LKDEVTRLAREHGIVTPYTSYLIIEDERSRRVPVAMQTQRELSADGFAHRGAEAKYGSARAEAAEPAARAGANAVANAQDLAALKSVENAAQQKEQGNRFAKGPVPATSASPQPSAGYKVAQSYGQQARVVNGRAFYQNGNTWTDATAQSRKDLKQRQLAFNSTEYFSLLSTNPEAAQWLALGNEVDVVLGDTLYQIR
jgi:Ca-activated chloride channel family protein